MHKVSREKVIIWKEIMRDQYELHKTKILVYNIPIVSAALAGLIGLYVTRGIDADPNIAGLLTILIGSLFVSNLLSNLFRLSKKVVTIRLLNFYLIIYDKKKSKLTSKEKEIIRLVRKKYTEFIQKMNNMNFGNAA